MRGREQSVFMVTVFIEHCMQFSYMPIVLPCYFGLTIHPTANVSEQVNRKCPYQHDLQLPVPTPALFPQTFHLQNLEISYLFIICCVLDYMTILVYVTTNLGEYCYPDDH